MREGDSHGRPGDPELGADGGGRADLVSTGFTAAPQHRPPGPASLAERAQQTPRSGGLERTGAAQVWQAPGVFTRRASQPLSLLVWAILLPTNYCWARRKRSTIYMYHGLLDCTGAKELAKDCVVCGTASESLYGASESLYKPDMEPEGLFQTISQALLSSSDRDCGWGGYALTDELGKDLVVSGTTPELLYGACEYV